VTENIHPKKRGNFSRDKRNINLLLDVHHYFLQQEDLIMEKVVISNKILEIVGDFAKKKGLTSITGEFPLIGDKGLLDSMNLVELCLSLEDFADELEFEFDWTSDSAMSRSRSMFKTVNSLTDEFITQMDKS